MTIDLFERNRIGNSLADKIDMSGECWEWTDYIPEGGY